MGVTQTNSDAAEGCVETTPSRASVLKQALKKKKDRRGWKEMGKTGSRTPPIKLGFPECDSYFTPVPQVDCT